MNRILESRRGFLKKAIYKTPTLFLFGSFGSSVIVHADASGGPDGPPGGFNSRSIKRSQRNTPRKRLKF